MQDTIHSPAESQGILFLCTARDHHLTGLAGWRIHHLLIPSRRVRPHTLSGQVEWFMGTQERGCSQGGDQLGTKCQEERELIINGECHYTSRQVIQWQESWNKRGYTDEH